MSAEAGWCHCGIGTCSIVQIDCLIPVPFITHLAFVEVNDLCNGVVGFSCFIYGPEFLLKTNIKRISFKKWEVPEEEVTSVVSNSKST